MSIGSFRPRALVRRMMNASHRQISKILVPTKSLGSERTSTDLVVLAAPGAGNLGDRAMLEAILHNSPQFDRVVVLCENVDNYLHPPLSDPRVKLVSIGRYLHGIGWGYLVELRAAMAVVARTGRFVAVGADMMDGGYGETGALRRWDLVVRCAKMGVDARVLGFSWNGRPPRDVARAARRAASAGAMLCVRDPQSHARMLQLVQSNVHEVRDVVFAHSYRDLLPSVDTPASPFVIVNVSGLIEGSIDQVPEYVEICRTALRAGLRVVLLPHVTGGKGSDVPTVERLADELRIWPDVDIARDVRTPSAVLSLVRSATVVVTGRMHLAILSLSVGTPAIVLATQGKVEGLMQAFDLPENCVQPVPGFGRKVTDRLESYLSADAASRDVLRSQIRSRAEVARTLARINFDPREPS